MIQKELKTLFKISINKNKINPLTIAILSEADARYELAIEYAHVVLKTAANSDQTKHAYKIIENSTTQIKELKALREKFSSN